MGKSIRYLKYDNVGCVDEYYEIDEYDFYPPEDDRLYCSGSDDVEGGDNYDDYVKWFWKEYENDIYN